VEPRRAPADEVICPHRPRPFAAVGSRYEDFEQLSDEDVPRTPAEADAERGRREGEVSTPEPAWRVPVGRRGRRPV
jgi:predicted phosphoribosyltransferase